MVKPIPVPGFNLEDIPQRVAKTIDTKLPINGGNCICVEADSPFGKWAIKQGVNFEEVNGKWTWIVVWR